MQKHNRTVMVKEQGMRNSTPHSFSAPDCIKYLDSIQLSELERCFEEWFKCTHSQSTRRIRGRIWLAFLVLRVTGAKVEETLALDDQKDIDLEQATIRFTNDEGSTREVPIPQDVVHEISCFLDDPLNDKLRGVVFKMEQDHLLREFQCVGSLCDIPIELANPAVLRRSRAIELLQDGIPANTVHSILGFSTTNHDTVPLESSNHELKCSPEQNLPK